MPEQTRLEQITFAELEEEWNSHAERLKIRRHQISPRRDQHNGEGTVHPKVEQEVAEIEERFAERRVDPLLTRVWTALDMPGKPPEAGVMPSQQGEPAEELKLGELRCAAVYWMLEQSGHTDPEEAGFGAELNRRRIEFDGASDRYRAVAKAELAKGRRLSIAVIHEVAQRLIEEGKPANAETVEEARQAVSRRRAHRKHRDISLADLATDAEVEIVPDHLKAAAVVWSYARHDDAGVFDALDHIVEDADFGRIAIGHRAVERIEDYRRDSAHRWLSPERVESLCDRVLGPPFPTLWRNLVIATHDFVGRLTTDDLIGSPAPANVGQESVRVAAAAVATHLSEQGWGTTYTAAEALQRQLGAARRILSLSSVERAYCSRDFFGVVTHATDVDVNQITRELALSEAGAIVISWLAVKADVLSGSSPGPLIVVEPLVTSDNPLEDPSDGDFVEACEQLYQLLELGASTQQEYDNDAGDQDATGAGDQDENATYSRRAESESGLRLTPSMFAAGRAQSRM
jgi:hypothetical protein